MPLDRFALPLALAAAGLALPEAAASRGVAPPAFSGMGQEVPRRAIYVFFPAVARTVGYRRKDEPVLEPRWIRDLGRSLGRVVAHELVHAIAPELPHTAGGLMSCSLTRRHLLAPRAALEAETASVFVAQLDRVLLAAGERAPAGGAMGGGGGRSGAEWRGKPRPALQRRTPSEREPF